MNAVWEFFTVENVPESELPLPEHRREKSPEQKEAESLWAAMCNFFTGTEVHESELPAPEGRLSEHAPSNKAASATPARESSNKAANATPAREPSNKRGRDASEANSTAVAPATAELSNLETLIRSSSVEELTKDRSVTVKGLQDYLGEKGAQLPPNAKKGDLVKLAHRTATETSVAPSPARTSSKVVAPVAAAAPVAEDDDETPSSKWPVAKMREYAAKHNIKIPADALRPDIWDLIATNTAVARSASKSKSSASLQRADSKRK